MHLQGRKANGGASRRGAVEPGGSARRGAWYPDPFEAAQERWWDGHGWTQEVRETPCGECPQTEPSDMRGAGSTRAPAQRNRDRAADFPIRMEAAEGADVRVVPIDVEASARAWRELGRRGSRWPAAARAMRFCDSYDLATADGRIASLAFGGRAELARMACAEGVWSLQTRRRGWDFVIESADGRNVGQYHGRRWLPGGTISLIGGAQVDLRRSLTGRWKLVATGTRQRIADIRIAEGPSMTLTIRSIPGVGTDMPLVLLTGCAVLLLERMMPRVPLVAGS